MKHEIRVPDLEDFDYVEVIEILTKKGDAVKSDDSILTIESDKAAVEMPAPVDGIVAEICVKIGDQVGEGHLLAVIDDDKDAQIATEETPEPPLEKVKTEEQTAVSAAAAPEAEPQTKSSPPPPTTPSAPQKMPSPEASKPTPNKPHATPGVRRFARSLGVDIASVSGSGHKGRTLSEDVENFVKDGLKTKRNESGAPQAKQIDFSLYGEVETVKMERVQRITAKRMKLSWLTIPHVTQHDEANVEMLETLRKSLKAKAEQEHIKLTILPFLIKALAETATVFPRFLSSINEADMTLTMKRYCHVGVAVDTPRGLLRPVLRDADKKSIFAIAAEVAALSERARNNSLRLNDVEGGCISISSLGNIGGSAFTPIVLSPEVAVLGVSKIYVKAFWDSERFVPRRMLPLDVSYDHRVINGAYTARFLAHYCRLLADPNSLL